MSDATSDFVGFLRSSAPYIHAHRGRTFVVVFGGEAMESAGIRALVHDVALLMSLGIRIVLVAGARPQIDARLALRGLEPRFEQGLRVTDAAAMACAKEASGTNRVELEALFSTALPNSPMAGSRIRIATGNYLTAKPVGVIDGVDYQYTGRVRRVDQEAIRRHLDDGQLVLLTPIGYSATGEAFNLATPEVAAAAAVSLCADKLICLVEGKGLVAKGGTIQGELALPDAEQLLAKKTKSVSSIERDLGAAVDAVRGGVRRAHIIPRRIEGGLLRELFTRDGVGTLVSAERFEGMRVARLGDVPSILELIEPLAASGQLVRRPREMLEEHVERFTVVERDGMIVACVAVYPFPTKKTAEIACVAVHPSYRAAGRADALVQYAERRAREQGMESVFVLTTQAEHFFRERGYEPTSEKKLPSGKKIDPSRKSKIFVKKL
jgi:amino-acid N-acetyltransferase